MRFLLYASVLLISISIAAQCPSGTIEFNTQSEIDNFPIVYPNCTELDGVDIVGAGITNLNGLSNIENIHNDLYIFNTSIGDFSGLQNLVQVDGTLYVISNLNLINFEGLDSLESLIQLNVEGNHSLINFQGLTSLVEVYTFSGGGTDGILVADNNSLVDLSGLESVEKIVNLHVRFNNSLESLDGLSGLTEIHGSLELQSNPSLSDISSLSNMHPQEVFGLSIDIMDNDSLVDLDGLENVTSISACYIRLNESLINIEGLSNLETVHTRMFIGDNPSLLNLDPIFDFILVDNEGDIGIRDNDLISKCDLPAICINLNNPAVVIEITNNAAGCNNLLEVEVDCEIVDIPDSNFLNALINHSPIIDLNGDQNIQYSEAEAFTGNMNVSNEGIFNFSGLESFVNISGLDVSENLMTFLYLDENTFLTSIDFSNNLNLVGVDLKNGNNMAITSFQGINCPMLEYVCVDDIAYAQSNFINIDPQVIFTENCELSVEEFDLNFSIFLYPNPVETDLNITISGPTLFLKANLYSIEGKLLLTTFDTNIDLSHFPRGLYIVKIETDHGNMIHKVVKD